MQQSILTNLGMLIRCDTQNPPRRIDSNHAIFAHINSVLQKADGFTVNLTDHGDGRISFFAIRGTPKILFNAHLDTVQVGNGWSRAALELTVEDGRAYGRGACDIKGAAAVLLALAENTELPLALLFTTDEEGANSCCVRRYASSMSAEDYDVVVVAEPTQCEAILGHRGYLSVLGAFSGEPGHSSEPRGLTDNAIHQACTWASAAVAYARTRQQEGNELCFNIGTIGGGSGSNVIAADANVHWSARVPPGIDTEAILSSICKLTEASSQLAWNARFNGSPLPAFGASDAAAEQFCKRNNLTIGAAVSFWTEAALFSQAGLPAIVLGPGNIEQAHSADEWVDLEQLWLAAGIYQRLAQENS
jgi:acetylornithine deacetylase